MKTRKIIAKVSLGILALIVVVIAGRAVLNITEGRRLERALSNLKAKGVPISAGELAAPCSDSDNGALLWKAAESLFVMENKYTATLNEAHKAAVEGRAIPADTRDVLLSLIDGNRKATDLMLEASGRSCFKYSDEPGPIYEAKIPEYIKLLRLTRLLGLESMLAVEAGGDAEVEVRVERLRKAFDLCRKTAEGGNLIGYLVSMADAKTCLMYLNRIVSGHSAGEGALLPIIAGLGDMQMARWRDLFAGSFRGERVLFLEIGLPVEPARLQREFGARDFFGKAYLWLIAPLIKKDIADSLPVYAELESTAGQSYYMTRALLKRVDERMNKRPWHAIVSGAVLSNSEAAFMKTATFEAVMLTTRTGIACRVFKARTGHYPGMLEELVSAGLLGAVPVDPFTGKPLIYKREGDGFVVYSLGSNLRDDGGRSTWEIKELVSDKDDDWAWRETK